MKTKIYALVHLITKEVVYVGQTTKTLIERLKGHYWKLNEANRGERTLTPLFKYLNNIKPLELEIVLLTEVESNEAEIYYIAECRKGNPNLLNETNGGIGGNTIVNKTEEQKRIIGNKISSILSGKAKPEGFAEHLSDIRIGKGNPMAKPLNPKIVVLKSSNDNSIIRSFDYVFEINQFLDDRNAGGNIVRQLKKKPYTRSKGYVFRYIKDKDIEKLNN